LKEISTALAKRSQQKELSRNRDSRRGVLLNGLQRGEGESTNAGIGMLELKKMRSFSSSSVSSQEKKEEAIPSWSLPPFRGRGGQTSGED